MSTFDLPVRFFRGFPAEKPLGFTQQSMHLNVEETALLLVDVYHAAEKPEAKDLVNSAWDTAFWEIVDDRLVPMIRTAREMKLPVIYVNNSSPRIEILRSSFGTRLTESLGFDPTRDFKETTVDPIEFDAGESIQLYIPAQIAPQPQDYFIRKHTYSGFYETRLDSLLRNLGIKNLLVAGFAADVCVLFTIADAVFRGYQTILVRDCTLAAELPHEVHNFTQTERITLYMETFLGPSTTAAEVRRLECRL